MRKKMSLWLLCFALSACCICKKHRQPAESFDSEPPPYQPSEEEVRKEIQKRYEQAYRDAHHIQASVPRFVQASASPTAATLASKANDFGFRFYAALKTQQENVGKNLFFSPISLHTLLTMAYLGATDKGAQELEQTLALQGLPDLPTAYYNLQGSMLKGMEGKAEIELANAMFIKESAGVSPEYQENVRKNFEAEIFKGSFDGETLAKINNWAKEKTRGIIPRILNGIDNNADLLLLNALYFKAFWEDGYEFKREETPFERDFTLADGNIIKMPFMAAEYDNYYAYLQNPQFAMLAIPYAGEVANLYIILPAKGVSLETIEKQLSESQLQAYIAQMQERKASVVMMPKINMSADIQASKLLQQMGIQRAFMGDLGKISPHSRLSGIIQKASLRIEEWGTVAAAVSTSSMETNSGVGTDEEKTFTFIADRPFFFFIREEKMKSILFMGRVMNPTQE